MKRVFVAVVALAASVAALRADRINLADGSVINGTIKSITGNTAVIATDFAGEVKVAQDKIVKIATSAPVNVAKPSGEKVSGQLGEEGGAIALPPADIKHLWTAGMDDPTIPPGRKWDGELSVDVTGKTGNTEKFNGGAGIKANLVGPIDKLQLYASAAYDRENGVTSTKKYLAGADYERKIAESKNTWYARLEFEQQTTSGLRLRSEAGLGYGYYAIDRERTKLRFRAGLTGKTRKYTDGTHDDATGMEVSAHFEQDIDAWGKWVTDLTYQPSFDSIHDYRVLHVSSLDIPILLGKPMSLRLGISNEYNSRTAEGAERLETTYFAKLVYKWK